MNSFKCFDGEMNGLVEYDSQLALSPVKGNPFDEDNFYPANGEAYGNDLAGEEGGPFDYASGDPYAKFEDLPSFSNFGGRIADEIRRRRRRREKKQDLRQRRRTARTLSKAGARQQTASAQNKLAAGLGASSTADVELAKALSTGGAGESKGLSTGAKIGIAVGVVAVVGVIGYMLYKRKK